MNRSEGLVRRVKTRSDTSDANSSAGNEENDNSPDRDEELDENDSKETRLTLMEEVLLLGLKDKEVKRRKIEWKSIGLIEKIWWAKLMGVKAELFMMFAFLCYDLT